MHDLAHLAGFVAAASVVGMLMFGAGHELLGPWAVDNGYADEVVAVYEQVRQIVGWV